jgi:hypothetical protein
VFKTISIVTDNAVRQCADRAAGGSEPSCHVNFVSKDRSQAQVIITKQALTHSLLRSFDKFIGSKIFLDYLLYKIYNPLKKSRKKMSFYLIHDLSIKSLRSYPDYNWSDNFMLSYADQPGNLEQTPPQRGEAMN